MIIFIKKLLIVIKKLLIKNFNYWVIKIIKKLSKKWSKNDQKQGSNFSAKNTKKTSHWGGPVSQKMVKINQRFYWVFDEKWDILQKSQISMCQLLSSLVFVSSLRLHLKFKKCVNISTCEQRSAHSPILILQFRISGVTRCTHFMLCWNFLFQLLTTNYEKMIKSL